MNRMVKKFMVVLVAAFMFLGAVTTPVQAKGRHSDPGDWGGFGGWFGSWWWTQPSEPAPEPEPEPSAETVVDETPSETEEPVVETVVEEAPAAEETPAVEETPAAEETVVETPVVEETPAEVEEQAEEATVWTEETVAETPVEYISGTIETESENYKVSVSMNEDALIPVGTQVKVTELKEDSDEYKAAKEAVEAEKESNVEGFAAFDITLYYGEEVIEPAATVSVSVEAKNIPADAEEIEIQHLNETEDESVAVELVAAEGEETPGTIELNETEAVAEFDVEGFSTFTLTWKTSSGAEQSATIHWVSTTDGETYSELANELVPVFDETAASISLANTFEGYSYSNTLYEPSAGTERETIKPTIDKGTNGWTLKQAVLDAETGTTTYEDVALANGSNIYVVYVEHVDRPSGDKDDKVPNPTTNKSVIDNHDGTYTIQLDVAGKTISETDKVGANVLIVLDQTSSMNEWMPRQSIYEQRVTRWTAAKNAINVLVNTLTTGDNAKNDIEFALLDFNCYTKGYDWWGNYVRGNDDVLHSWNQSTGAHQNSGTNYWTKFSAQFNNYIQSDSYNWDSNTNGTNWESPLNSAMTILDKRDDDNTYVIFITDGEPNMRGIDTVYSDGDKVTPATDKAKAITALDGVYLYGVFCGNDNGYDNLNDVITGADGEKTINGKDETTLTKEFESIAHTIISDLGTENVSVDDGIPSLSSISSNVVGEPGGYEYYRSTDNGKTFSKWDDAPGASYSNDNGVTWDLSSVGTVTAGMVFRLKFTVWPSQDAYDYIADLNNGLIKPVPDEATLLSKGITKDAATGVYSLMTNTHLNTTYTFKDQTYSDSPDKLPQEAMILPTETISVKKEWNNDLDGRSAAPVQLIITKDGEEYLNDASKTTVSNDNNWTINGIYISMGQITVHNGEAKVIESGHDYTVIEPENLTYHWELTADVYHPMVVNGEVKNLVLDNDPTATVDNVKTFEINGKLYTVKTGDNANTITATNDRRSFLDVTKVVEGTGAPADAKFEYTIKIDNPKGTHLSDGEKYDTDDDFWFDITTVADPETALLDMDVTGATAEVRDGQPTGYWHAPNGSTVTIKMQADWNVRFTNLRSGTAYEVEESLAMDPGFVFEKAAATVKGEGTAATVTDRKATGTIDKPNTDYKVTYTNKYLGYFYVYHSSDNSIERLPMALNGQPVYTEESKFNIVAKTNKNTLYGGYYHGYMGASASYDQINGTAESGTIAYDDNGIGQDKEDAEPYDYDYISSNSRAVWNDQTVYTDAGTGFLPVTNAVYYLKEVPNKYLLPYTHYTYNKSDKLLRNMWYISATDDLRYGEAGFLVETVDANEKKTATFVDTLTVKNATGGATVKLSPKSVFGNKGGVGKGVQAGYLTYWDASNLIKANTTSVFTPYWKTPDGIYVLGTNTRTVSFNNGKVGSGGMRITDAANSTPFAELN